MLKKTITYEGLDGQDVTEEFWFHLSKADLIEMELNTDGGMGAQLQQIIDSNDNRQIFAVMKKLVLSAYGKRSEDGKRFVKNATIREEFEGSEAFSELIMDLMSNEDAAADFFNAVVPRTLIQEAQAAASIERPEPMEPKFPDPDTNVMPEDRDDPPRKVLTPREIEEMDSNDLKSGLAEGRYVIG